MREYENIHCHTWLSNALLNMPDSPVGLEDYAKVYAERDMKCLIASEHGYRGDVWQQADIGKAYGLKPICAAEVYFVPDRLAVDSDGKKDRRNFHLLLAAKNLEGFHELNEILSESQMSGFYYHGRVDYELLQRLNPKNFICSTACIGGVIKDPLGEGMCIRLWDIFRENFRLEIQPHLNEQQIEHNKKVLHLYQKYKWPLLFCTDSHYVTMEHKQLRKELQLSKGVDLDDSMWDLNLPTADEAFSMLSQQGIFTRAQIEEAMANTLEVRDWEGFSYTTGKKLPISKFRQNQSKEERVKAYRDAVLTGYTKANGGIEDWEREELEKEMAVIIDTDTSDYFLSLKDMLDLGVKKGGILTTTARGSAGSFASNYGLGFTTINRLKSPVQFYPDRFISKDKLIAGLPD